MNPEDKLILIICGVLALAIFCGLLAIDIASVVS